MKSFWGSVVLFAIIVFAVIINGIYIIHVSDRLSAYAEQLEKEKNPATLLGELQDFWDYHRRFLSLSVDTATIDEVEKIILALAVSHQNSNLHEFEKHRAYLDEMSKEISRLERLDIENIF